MKHKGQNMYNQLESLEGDFSKRKDLVDQRHSPRRVPAVSNSHSQHNTSLLSLLNQNSGRAL